MVLEQEVASIIDFILEHTDLEDGGRPAPYYYKVPQSFNVPAVYFPPPEISTDGETMITYGMDYSMYVKFFARTSEEAYRYGLKAATAIRMKRNLIPIIGDNGEETDEQGIRTNDPTVKLLDDGAVQVAVTWRSRRPYDDKVPLKMVTYTLNSYTKSIDADTEEEMERYINETNETH